MKRIILFASFIVCFFLNVGAKTPIVQMMEGEVRVGMTTPLGGYHDGKAKLSASLGIEGRYNFRGTPWDCGLMLDLSTARQTTNICLTMAATAGKVTAHWLLR